MVHGFFSNLSQIHAMPGDYYTVPLWTTSKGENNDHDLFHLRKTQLVSLFSKGLRVPVSAESMMFSVTILQVTGNLFYIDTKRTCIAINCVVLKRGEIYTANLLIQNLSYWGFNNKEIDKNYTYTDISHKWIFCFIVETAQKPTSDRNFLPVTAT